jgi:hypothetical protein
VTEGGTSKGSKSRSRSTIKSIGRRKRGVVTLPRVVTCGARGVTFHRKRKERELEEAAGYGGAAPAAAARKSQKAGEEGEAQDAK